MRYIKSIILTSIASIVVFIPTHAPIGVHPASINEVVRTPNVPPQTLTDLPQAEINLASYKVLPKPPEPVKTAPVAQTGGGCADWMRQAGIPQTAATNKLILKESNCRTNAINPSSGACGIPQAYPCSKLPCPLNDSGAVCQLQWMDNYVKRSYGSWDNALAKWYSRCGSKQGCWY